MRRLLTTVEIDASPARVYQILTDLERYAEWNPFVVQAKGRLAPGERLSIRMRPPGARERPYTVRVVTLEPERTFRWLGHMGLPGVLDGLHTFAIEPKGPASVRLVHEEEFRGLLVPFVWRAFLSTHLLAGFEELNRALKLRAERRED